MTATIRQCDTCGYRTFISSDDLKEKECHRCKQGKLEIISKEIVQ